MASIDGYFGVKQPAEEDIDQRLGRSEEKRGHEKKMLTAKLPTADCGRIVRERALRKANLKSV